MDAMVFACLADPTRLALLRTVAAAPATVGAPAGALGISRPACARHVRRLAAAGFVHTRHSGRATVVTANPPPHLPQLADIFLGLPAARAPSSPSREVEIRAL